MKVFVVLSCLLGCSGVPTSLQSEELHGVSALRFKGDKGDKGDQGNKGDKGAKGADGTDQSAEIAYLKTALAMSCTEAACYEFLNDAPYCREAIEGIDFPASTSKTVKKADVVPATHFAASTSKTVKKADVVPAKVAEYTKGRFQSCAEVAAKGQCDHKMAQAGCEATCADTKTVRTKTYDVGPDCAEADKDCITEYFDNFDPDNMPPFAGILPPSAPPHAPAGWTPENAIADEPNDDSDYHAFHAQQHAAKIKQWEDDYQSEAVKVCKSKFRVA